MFDTLSNKFYDAFRNIRGKSSISADNIETTLKEVRTALLEADVNFKVVRDFIESVRTKALGENVLRGVEPGEQFVKICHDELARVMGDANEELTLERAAAIPILIVGLNGAGKTTFCGKLANHLKNKKNKDVLLVPCDTYRPAAKDQLIVHANKLGVEYFDSDLSMAPREIAMAAMKKAAELGKQIVIIDTAGRLHVDEELMGQLKDVKEALLPMKPEVLLVADAMTGQEAVNVAKSFHEAVTLTGVVLSKMDSDARGGAALSIRHVTGVSIRYVSNGEKLTDLELFHPDRLAKRILEMGDVLTLVEKAEEAIDVNETESMMKNLQKGKFTVDDFMKQMNMMSRLGSMQGILKMIPGMGGILRQVGDLSPAENEMKKMKIIISSMTKAEKDDYKVVKESRIKRIAKGSGMTEQNVKEFLAKFAQMEQMMGGLMSMMKGGFPGMPGMPNMGGGLPGGMPNFPGMPNMPGMGGPQKGFRQQAGQSGKLQNKGKRKSPYGSFF